MANDRATYTDDQKQEALAILGQQQGNLSAVSRLTGVPRKTLAYWAEKAGIRGTQPDGTVLTGTKAEQLAVRSAWEKVVDLHLSELQKPEKAAKASARDNVIVAGTAQDKVWILSGRPTSHESREVRVTFAAAPEARSLRELAQLTMEGSTTRALPEATIIDVTPIERPAS